MIDAKVYWRNAKFESPLSESEMKELGGDLDMRFGSSSTWRWQSAEGSEEDCKVLEDRLRGRWSRVVPWSIRTVQFKSHSRTRGLDRVPGVKPNPGLYDQSYLCGREHGGVGAKAVWSLEGGAGNKLGQRVEIVLCDIGFGSPSKSCLSKTVQFIGCDQGSPDDRAHGRAVLGILAAKASNLGVRGLVFGARIRAVSIGDYGTVDLGRKGKIDFLRLLLSYANELPRGSVVVLPVWFRLPPGDEQFPIEMLPFGRRVIRKLTKKGVHVVQAAGNHGQTLKTWVRGPSLVIGAAAPEAPVPILETNRGRRVDLHSWGSDIMSLGLDSNGEEFENGDFGETSMATAIVGGVVAALSSALKHAVQNRAAASFQDPVTLKWLLRKTSYWKVPGLGGRPDLEAAIEFMTRRGVLFRPAGRLIAPIRRWGGMDRWD